jgi:hypothetical protein
MKALIIFCIQSTSFLTSSISNKKTVFNSKSFIICCRNIILTFYEQTTSFSIWGIIYENTVFKQNQIFLTIFILIFAIFILNPSWKFIVPYSTTINQSSIIYKCKFFKFILIYRISNHKTTSRNFKEKNIN